MTTKQEERYLCAVASGGSGAYEGAIQQALSGTYSGGYTQRLIAVLRSYLNRSDGGLPDLWAEFCRERGLNTANDAGYEFQALLGELSVSANFLSSDWLNRDYSGSAETFTRTTSRYIQDYRGVFRPIPSGAIGLNGLRRVRNIWDETATTWYESFATVTDSYSTDADGYKISRVVGTASQNWAIGRDSTQYGILSTLAAGHKVVFSCYLKSTDGTAQTFRSYGDSSAGEEITISGSSWVRYSFAFTVATGGAARRYGFTRDVSQSAADFLIKKAQLEITHGHEDVTIPSEFSSFKSGEYGVDYYNYNNGTTVASNVVTEGTGTTTFRQQTNLTADGLPIGCYRPVLYEKIARSTAYTAGQVRYEISDDDGYGYEYTCTVGGTSDATRPTFNNTGTTTDNDITWTVGNRYSHLAGFAYDPQRKNELTNSTDFSAWSLTLTPVVTANGANIFGEPAFAYKVEDDNASGIEGIYQTVSTTSSSNTHSATFWIRYSSASNRVGLSLQIINGTAVKSEWAFDPATGTLTARSTNAGTVTAQAIRHRELIDSTGSEWWEVNVTATDNASGNTQTQVGISPAIATTDTATWDTTKTGFCHISYAGLVLNSSTPLSVVRTTTAADTYNRDALQLSLSNHNQTEGMVVVSIVLKDGTENYSGSGQSGLISLNAGFTSVLYYKPGSPRIQTYDGTTGNTFLISPAPTVLRAGVWWDASIGKYQLAYNGSADPGIVDYDGEFTVASAIEIMQVSPVSGTVVSIEYYHRNLGIEYLKSLTKLNG